MSSFNYVVDEDFDYVFDERGNTVLSMRKVAWGNNASLDNTKIELRKWYTNADGEETPNKGFSFLTEEGPNNLTRVLLEAGFGNTFETLSVLKNREDFRSSLNRVLGKDDEHFDNSIPDEMYDATTSLFNYEED